MKIRGSFVANSSSSSFIIVGKRRSLEPKLDRTYRDDLIDRYSNFLEMKGIDLEILEDGDEGIVGVSVASTYSSICSVHDLDDFIKSLEDARDKCKEHNIEAKLYYGGDAR